MRTIKIKSVENFIVVSDVHLRNPKDTNTELFIKTLDDLLTNKKSTTIKIDAIFFLGDIFDFITASKKFFINHWKLVFNKIKELKEAGIKTYFIEGNHDFGFEHFKSKWLDQFFTEYGDITIELQHKNIGTIVLRHGDDIICPQNYLPFRNFVKNKYFQWITHFLFPGFFMNFIFSRYAKLSRKKDKYRTMQKEFLLNCLNNYLKKFNIENKKIIDILIIGHIHVFINKKIENTHLLVGTDWFSAPNYLHITENGNAGHHFITKSVPENFL